MTTQINALFKDKIISFIGSGVMGEAMISGLLSKNVISPIQIIAADPLTDRLAELNQRYGVMTTENNRDAARSADVLILSIKPQGLDSVLKELHGLDERKSHVVMSILAGASIHQLSEGLGTPNVIRCMPNTPARIGQGITVWTASPSVPETQREQARAILTSFGQEVFVEEEHYLDMATALSGTGPA